MIKEIDILYLLHYDAFRTNFKEDIITQYYNILNEPNNPALGKFEGCFLLGLQKKILITKIEVELCQKTGVDIYSWIMDFKYYNYD